MKNFLTELGYNEFTEVQRKIFKLNENRNKIILSPTGSGKTEGIYNIILNRNHKSIIIEPMRTLATCICDRLNQYNSKLRLEEWNIQHSSISTDKLLQSKYCVSTIDQVLYGMLGIGTQSFIKGKNVITSDLYFDEVQLFEPDKTLLTTIHILDSIYAMGNTVFTIMTATMPMYLINFLKDRYDMDVIICEEESIKNRKVKINYCVDLDFEKIEAFEGKQTIICNSQSQQEFIYDNIKNKDRVIKLNNKILKTDRENVEKILFENFGKQSKDNNKILLTTQIIEAGVDVSANRVYSISAPIDCLIQRAGRCCRWGGYGEFIVIDYYEKYNVYNQEIVGNTMNIIKQNNDIDFTWDKQKEWVDEILTPFYEKYINDKQIKIKAVRMKNNNTNELIRDIKAFNIIVKNTMYGATEDMFNYESVSVNYNNRNKLKNNEIHILDKKQIKAISYKDINIGDTVVINNKNCIYDDLGFRFREGETCQEFNYALKEQIKHNEYTDYIIEPWINHANLTRECLRNKLSKYRYIDYIDKNFDKICNFGGLHDLGKLDIEWFKWSGSIDEPLAHFPFTKIPFTHRDRKHNYISAYVLKDYLDPIMFNVILQHHKRIVCVDDNLFIQEYKLHNKTIELLKEYGFTQDICTYNKQIKIKENEIMTPTHKDWNIFLIITGVLMESDIEAINIYINQNNTYNI